MVATIALSPTTGPLGMQGVRVTGAGYTASAVINAVTYNAVACATNTLIGQIVAADGSFTGTLTIPMTAVGAHNITVTSNNPDTASASFTSTTSIYPQTAVHAKSLSTGTVTATGLSATSGDLVVATVFWHDTGATSISVSSITDTTGLSLNWVPRGQPITNGAWILSGSFPGTYTRTYDQYYLQIFTAVATGTITNKNVTATFSAVPSGECAISVVGLLDVATPASFDSNGGLPSPYVVTVINADVETFSAKVSNRNAPALLFGAMMLAPSNAVTVGTGMKGIDAYDATDYYLCTECAIVTTPQVDYAITGSATTTLGTSGAWILVGCVDAYLQANASNAPWVTEDIGAEVQGITIKGGVTTPATSTETGVAKWEMPTISASTPYQKVINDRSGGTTGVTTTGTTSTVLHDTNLSLTVNALTGQTLTYTSGQAMGQSRTVASNTANTITTSPAFSPAPLDAGESFTVSPSLIQTDTSKKESIIGIGGQENNWETTTTTVAP